MLWDFLCDQSNNLRHLYMRSETRIEVGVRFLHIQFFDFEYDSVRPLGVDVKLTLLGSAEI
jgi:hypothetical protein